MRSLVQRFLRVPIVSISVIALLAALVSLLVFTPKFAYWRGLGNPYMVTLEIVRANDALMQLQHPLVKIDNFFNRVIQWRLFFPIICHALSVPPKVYLVLPDVGCLLVLIFIVRLLRQHGFGWLECLAGAILLATCSWYFVSTGFLAYFDSWYILGLLVVVFVPDWRFGVAAVLITPWVDERFVITLPLSFLLRLAYLQTFGSPRDDRQNVRETLGVFLALLPWLLIRFGFFLKGHDSATNDYLADMIPNQSIITARFYALGLWQGIRWAWLFVIAWLVFGWRESRYWTAAQLLLLLLALGLLMAIAQDLSRSVSILVPVIFYGVMLLRKHQPRWCRPILLVACGLNLVFPAEHICANVTVPINHFPAELERLSNPPVWITPAWFLTYRATELNQAGWKREALPILTKAIQLDPTYANAYSKRGAIEFELGDFSQALADLNTALKLNPKQPNVWFDRGILRAKQGDFSGAITDLKEALLHAPPDWPVMERAKATLKKLQAKVTGQSDVSHVPDGKKSH
jgi:tetratricopeptide (TPR) repeat protein